MLTPRIALRRAADMPSSPISSLLDLDLAFLYDLIDLLDFARDRDLVDRFTDLGLYFTLTRCDRTERLLSLLALYGTEIDLLGRFR